MLTCLFVSPALSEDWHNLVQPIGTLIVVETAATVNTRLGGNPPFDTATDVTTIQTTTPQYFVRFYNPTDPTNPSNAVGSWIMRAATVRGLTPAQVRDVFALPAMPTNMTMVLVSSGYKMYTGIAGPIAGWGAGGAQQSKLIGPPWVDAANYFNQQPIMACILCYGSLAPSGNTNRIATYLDGRIPTAYSDLENAYLNLDKLYTTELAGQFQDALDQIGPARFDNLTTDALRASALYNDEVDQRVSEVFLGKKERARFQPYLVGSLIVPVKRNDEPDNNLWLRLAGGVVRAGDLGFNATSQGVTIGADKKISDDALAGFSFGLVHSELDWTGPGGRVKTDYARFGIYTAWLFRDLFIQASLNTGFSQSDASRRIVFSDISRTATSHPNGWEVNPRLRLGYRLPVDTLDIMPTASLDYFQQYRDSYTESGADSLNLRVDSVRNRTVRSYLGVNISKDMPLQEKTLITPRLRGGWAREHSMDNHSITAGLQGESDNFTVYGVDKTTDILTVGMGVILTSEKNFSLTANCGLEYRQEMTDQTLSLGLNYRF